MSEEYYDFDYVNNDETLEEYQSARIKEMEGVINSLHNRLETSLKNNEIERSLNEGIRFWFKLEWQVFREYNRVPPGETKKAREIREHEREIFKYIFDTYLREIKFAHPRTNPDPYILFTYKTIYKAVKNSTMNRARMAVASVVERGFVTKAPPEPPDRWLETNIDLNGVRKTRTRFAGKMKLGLPHEELQLKDPFPTPAKIRVVPALSMDTLITRFLREWPVYPMEAGELYQSFVSGLSESQQQEISLRRFGDVARTLVIKRLHPRTRRAIYLGLIADTQ